MGKEREWRTTLVPGSHEIGSPIICIPGEFRKGNKFVGIEVSKGKFEILKWRTRAFSQAVPVLG